MLLLLRSDPFFECGFLVLPIPFLDNLFFH